eukprot:Hpha_TRINITY_DN7254_c0_g1::TRINITY_DN7254_c0_g1_i1::g.102326::m.102326
MVAGAEVRRENCFFAVAVSAKAPAEVVVPAGLLLQLTHAALPHDANPREPVTVSYAQYRAPAAPAAVLSAESPNAALQLSFTSTVRLSVRGPSSVTVHLCGNWLVNDLDGPGG